MKNILHRALSVLAIAGGAVAVLLFASQLLALKPNFFGCLGVMFYTAIGFWGIVCGVLLLERDHRARWHNLRFWAIQVPVFLLPGIGHKLGIGVFLFAWVEYPFRLSFSMSMGAQFSFRLFQIEQPTVMGVNLIALALVALIYRAIPEVASNPSIERTS